MIIGMAWCINYLPFPIPRLDCISEWHGFKPFPLPPSQLTVFWIGISLSTYFNSLRMDINRHSPVFLNPWSCSSMIFMAMCQSYEINRMIFIERNKFSFTMFWRSEEHTSELQSRGHLVCRLLLEKKKINII